MSPILLTLAEYLVAFLLVIGGGFILIGSWGLARLPSLMTRLHGPTKASTLGVGACLFASMIFFPVFDGQYSAHELLIALFLFLTAPVSAQMIAKAHLHLALKGGSARLEDPPPPSGVEDRDWATFESLDTGDQDPEARPPA